MKARESFKRARREDVSEESHPEGSVSNSGEVNPAPTERSSDSEVDSTHDASYDPQEELSADANLLLEQFVEDWVLTLDREDKISLALFLCYHFQHLLNFTQTRAAEYAGVMLGKLDRAIRQWRQDFIQHGEVPESKQGKYQRSGVLWSSEELNEKVSKFVREHAAVKGEPNLKTATFCEWVNEDLLPNSSLEPGFPRKISIETARKWLHELGFEVLTPAKGMFFDGHERDDVVEYRGQFLRKMIEIGFLHPEQAPTPEAAAAFPSDVPLALAEQRAKTVVFFHDESTFHVNEDQPFQWGEKRQLHAASKKQRVWHYDLGLC